MIRYTLVLCLCILMLSCGSKSKMGKASHDEMVVVKGQLLHTRSYCGGAPPEQDLLDELRRPVPLTEYEVFLRPGRTNDINMDVLKRTVTDEEGRFSFHVPAGDYVLLTKHHIDAAILDAPGKDIKIHDAKALQKWWEEGLAATQGGVPINLTFRQRCYLPIGVPGLRYTGPQAP